MCERELRCWLHNQPDMSDNRTGLASLPKVLLVQAALRLLARRRAHVERGQLPGVTPPPLPLYTGFVKKGAADAGSASASAAALAYTTEATRHVQQAMASLREEVDAKEAALLAAVHQRAASFVAAHKARARHALVQFYPVS